MFRQSVRLVRQKRSTRVPTETSNEWFFLLVYYPLNFCLIYWPLPLLFGYEPRIREAKSLLWQESSGKEKWLLFHVLLALLVATIVYWCARSFYRPNRFLILPIILAAISVLVYLLAPASLY
jgi:hypothetical protein